MSNRHQFRADWHDYNRGIYFVTICTSEKKQIFGHIVNSQMRYSREGEIAKDCLTNIPKHHPGVEIWNHVVMPNHIHMVLAVGAQYIAPASSKPNIGCLKPPRHGGSCNDNHFNSALAVVVRTFKAAVTRMVRAADTTWTQYSGRAQCIAPLPQATNMVDAPLLWQRNYHEHIIRDERAYDNIMNYIDNNIINWQQDCFFGREHNTLLPPKPWELQ